MNVDTGVLSGLVLEVVNTVLLSFTLSEVLLRRALNVRLPLAFLAIVNLTMSSRVHALLRWCGIGITGSWIVLPAALADLLAAASSAPSQRVCCVLRVLAVPAAFALLTYFDARRSRPKPYSLITFVHELGGSLALVLPVFPCLIAGFSCLFLVVSCMLQKVGLPAHLGEEMIFYGQFYAPLSAVYWTIKKNLIMTERSRTVLPFSEFSRSGSRLE